VNAPLAIDPATGRLRVRDVERLHQAVGGDPVTEALVLRFIGARWGAKNLFYLPAVVAGEAVRRPADFLRAAKRHDQPELLIVTNL
jgi:hypothetical protein